MENKYKKCLSIIKIVHRKVNSQIRGKNLIIKKDNKVVRCKIGPMNYPNKGWNNLE